MTKRHAIVTYDHPPLTEVVIGVQFERLAELDAARLGLLWAKFRTRFPKTDQKPALDPTVERLGLRGPLGEARIELSTDFRQRLWFLNEPGDELVQVQGDRFIRNWRRAGASEGDYPRFSELLPRFLDDLSVFREFLTTEHIGPLDANQCEVTYVNLIEADAHWATHAQLSRVFCGWSQDYERQIEFPVEAVQLKVAHLLHDQDGAFVGRLHVSIEPAFSAPQGSPAAPVPAFRLILTARGRPIGQGQAGIDAFLDLGHRAVVTSFDRMATSEMRNAWGRQ